MAEVGSVFSVDELLARSKAAAASKSSAAGGSKIQQMLAGREDPADKVDLSPVGKLLAAQAEKAKSTETPFTEQDWYINAKVAQLKGQIYTYSNLPGLDPSGAIMDGLTKEVNALVGKQQAKLKKSQDEAAAKQAELDKLKQAEADAPISVETLLKNAKDRANGVKPEVEISDAVKALLDNAKKGASVNQTA
jgi:hypothetical protein